MSNKIENMIDDLAARFIEATGDDAPPPEFAKIKEAYRKLKGESQARHCEGGR